MERSVVQIYLQHHVFLLPLKGLIQDLFQQVPLHLYDKKEHAGALLPSSSLALPFTRTSTGTWGELALAPEPAAGAAEMVPGDKVETELAQRSMQSSAQQMLAVISIFNNHISPPSLGILLITQNIIYSMLVLCLCLSPLPNFTNQ